MGESNTYTVAAFPTPDEGSTYLITVTREVNRGIPAPDQTSWIASIPLVFIPGGFLLLIYTAVYYTLYAAEYSVETVRHRISSD